MKKAFLPLLLALCLLLPACAGEIPASGEAETRIVTSFYPIYVATLNIAGDIDGVAVINLASPETGCLHDYTLTTDNMKTLEKADIFVINGAGMESFLSKALSAQSELPIVDASEGIQLLEASHGHGDEHDHDHDHDHEDGHEHETNPHVFVSVTGAMAQAENIAEGLAAADPARAEQYRANADAYIAKLSALSLRMKAELEPAAHAPIVTFHEAFDYFAADFELDIVAVVEREPGSEPSAAELAETIDIIRESGCRAIFAEPQYSAKSAETIARETGAALYTLDPVVTAQGGGDRDAYLDAMERNLETLLAALA